MILDRHPNDYCMKIGMEKRARCSNCGKWIEQGEIAWSYLPVPVDGNYVEHEKCRYGFDPLKKNGRDVLPNALA